MTEKQGQIQRDPEACNRSLPLLQLLQLLLLVPWRLLQLRPTSTGLVWRLPGCLLHLRATEYPARELRKLQPLLQLPQSRPSTKPNNYRYRGLCQGWLEAGRGPEALKKCTSARPAPGRLRTSRTETIT